ncbi:urease accessory protein UreE [Sneathiella sp. P13V-1]|uniref:urease accessory protein UreE n=1 Tax=Sneathiella sp. P13V-1 TaxID=2697366 RepID=UPI00187BB743|nr:urease accessory protein UreE [Sneathiella sp. P13V-1]MBE7635340.1 urease accessory protein UreE [Sneathiella sp. P13V-1]
MKTVLKHVSASDGFGGEIVGRITLDFDNRRRRRIRLTSDEGIDFLLNLEEVATLRDGDFLLLDEVEAIRVVAAQEPVVDVTCKNTAELVRVAWHLGNRHLPTQLMGDVIRIRQDHVIEEMLTLLGATPKRVLAPFNPEGGAYGHGETMGHDHGHDHSHGHNHSHSHGHSHD